MKSADSLQSADHQVHRFQSDNVYCHRTHAQACPPPGRTLFIIGQDNDMIGEYMDAIPSPYPGGVMGRAVLHRLLG
ncbi:MAG: hypothetical protein WBB55_01040 [Anaerolineales bacterium]